MSWIQDLINPKGRLWEEFYRNRWQYDNIVRSTHGVNCTGGCSWNVFVKDGIITWEMQATDYPLLEANLPPYEPRGCQRGISASWYVYSPLRVKYPYVRGALLDLWLEAKAKYDDPIEAWGSIVEDDQKRTSYQHARGKGAFAVQPGMRCLSSLLLLAFIPQRNGGLTVSLASLPSLLCLTSPMLEARASCSFWEV